MWAAVGYRDRGLLVAAGVYFIVGQRLNPFCHVFSQPRIETWNGVRGREGIKLGRLSLRTCVMTSRKQYPSYTNKNDTPKLQRHTQTGPHLAQVSSCCIDFPWLWKMGREEESCARFSRGTVCVSVKGDSKSWESAEWVPFASHWGLQLGMH